AYVQYNMSGKNTNPSIVATAGGFPTFGDLVQDGVGPYRDFSCMAAGDTCDWGDYSAATPDPRPSVANHGAVWGTNQFSGLASPPPNGVNWRTRIFKLEP